MGIKVKNTSLIEGVYLKKLNEIPVKGGNVLKYINVEDKNFIKFGEVYLSCIDHKYVKGWKKHKIATLNLIVPVGEVKFVLFDDRNWSATNGAFQEIILSRDNFNRLTVAPNVWMSFQGLSNESSIIVNLIDIIHDPNES